MIESRIPSFFPPESIAWVEQHRDLLELIAGDLQSAGSWPSAKGLTRRLVRDGHPIAVEDIVWRMPKALGFRNNNPDEIVLSLFGLRCTDAGCSLLDGFVRVLRTAIDRYEGGDEQPVISRSDVESAAEDAGSNPAALQEIVLREAPFLDGGSGGPGDDWTRAVGTGIVRYWAVSTAEEYLHVRASELRGNPQLGWPAPQQETSEATSDSHHQAGSDAAGFSVEVPAATGARDVFVSHAGEDKENVARPLADALRDSGWSVWIDQYELTVGDSLNGSINAGLASSRFGVVILSEAFFAKHWTRQELNGLAAREATSRSKVILPVWHGIDQKYLAEVAPMLADRLGVSTDTGIAHVADQLARALDRERLAPRERGHADRIVRSVESVRDVEPALHVPRTAHDRDQLVEGRPSHWEYYLFASELFLAMQALEPAWHDHELRQGTGERHYLDALEAGKFLSQSFKSLSKTLHNSQRVYDPAVQEQAFGKPGEPGDPERISQLARLTLRQYEELLRTAATLRNQVVPDEFDEPYELAAQMTDKPLAQLRDFVNQAVSSMDELADRIADHDPEGGPVTVTLSLVLSTDDEIQTRFHAAMEQITG